MRRRGQRPNAGTLELPIQIVATSVRNRDPAPTWIPPRGNPSMLGNIDLWRSEEMQLVQLMMPAESARDTIASLGEVGMLQFKDLNVEKSAFQRTHANQIKRLDEMARKLRYFGEQVGKTSLSTSAKPPVKEPTLDELETKLEALESEVSQMNVNTQRLQRTQAELQELQTLLEKAGVFFDQARKAATTTASPQPSASADDLAAPLMGADSLASQHLLGFVAGLVQQQKLSSFERILFRTTRGNVFIRSASVGKVQDPASGEMQEKSVFVVFFAGDRARAKIMKICEAYNANRYPFPEDQATQRQTHGEVVSRLHELNSTIQAGEAHLMATLTNVASTLEQWTLMVRKEKAIYHTLNKMNLDFTCKVLVGEAWVPSAARAQVHEALRTASEHSSTYGIGTVLQPLAHDGQDPPTFFKTNKFTECFQNIVDAYGTARYREVNPTVFTLMTFPFLFAVMFGDFGHGLLMLMFALALVLNEKKLGSIKLDDMSEMAYNGRYCILMMSLFSIYVGAIYNEFFSIPMTLGGLTHFKCFLNDEAEPTGPTDLRDCKSVHGEIGFPGGDPYPFGVDPSWRGTNTELPYLNSMKMKLSILLGVTHMNLGILMSWFNNTYFRDKLSTWCEFVPQMIFLNGLFGYLCMLIIYKWLTGSVADLYHVMIYMFLGPGTMDEKDPGYLFPGQGLVQVVLLMLALVAVPWMLIPKPLILKKRFEAAKKHDDDSAYHQIGDEEGAPVAHGGGGGGHGHGEFEFGEVVVHQMIHTIEFVLGAVSNTASYLRLWALSLAHSQLSAVFYDRVLMAAVQSGSPIAMVIGFFVWAMATMGVLMVMESLSAFLHALRLHWVEFQNKFYKGDGYRFAPFTFAEMDGKVEEEVKL